MKNDLHESLDLLFNLFEVQLKMAEELGKTEKAKKGSLGRAKESLLTILMLLSQAGNSSELTQAREKVEKKLKLLEAHINEINRQQLSENAENSLDVSGLSDNQIQSLDTEDLVSGPPVPGLQKDEKDISVILGIQKENDENSQKHKNAISKNERNTNDTPAKENQENRTSYQKKAYQSAGLAARTCAFKVKGNSRNNVEKTEKPAKTIQNSRWR